MLSRYLAAHELLNHLKSPSLLSRLPPEIFPILPTTLCYHGPDSYQFDHRSLSTLIHRTYRFLVDTPSPCLSLLRK